MTTHQSGTLLFGGTAQSLSILMWLSPIFVSCLESNTTSGSFHESIVKTTDFHHGSLVTCATVDPSVVSVVTRSLFECSQACTTSTRCVGFNFLSGIQTCERFATEPAGFLIIDGCKFYGVTRSFFCKFVGVTIKMKIYIQEETSSYLKLFSPRPIYLLIYV